MQGLGFRAWLKNEKAMQHVYAIDFETKKIAIHDYIYVNFKDVDLMRYTGSIDKNNEVIFEGDIVKVCIEEAILYEYDIPCITVKDEKIGVVKYDGWRFYIDTDDRAIHSCQTIEVLGNIYENPELLESKKDE